MQFGIGEQGLTVVALNTKTSLSLNEDQMVLSSLQNINRTPKYYYEIYLTGIGGLERNDVSIIILLV